MFKRVSILKTLAKKREQGNSPCYEGVLSGTKALAVFAAIFLGLFCAIPTFALDKDKLIRVGISNSNFTKLVYDNAEFTANGDYEVIDMASGFSSGIIPSDCPVKIVLKNAKYSIIKSGQIIASNLDGPLVIRPQKGTLINIVGLKRGGKTAYYRGIIELCKSSKNQDLFSIVNVLDLESYLKGVVPNEMPVHFGLEALKAQTVAARNYALKPRERFYKEFDVSDSVACQVYFGANTEKELSNKAIKETNGIIALSPDEELILALYSSTAGGYTENYENAFSDPKTRAFPPQPISYLKARPDKEGTKKLNDEKDAREFYTSTPDTFDNNSPYFRWKREWMADELEDVLKKTLIEQSATGFVKPKLTAQNICDFGNLMNIKVLKRGDSGKIVHLLIDTDKEDFVLSKELVIRRIFKKDGKALPSGNFVIDLADTPEGGKFTFQGGGFGHGVGLSQYGAGKMSSLGYSYGEILQHYYTGIKLTTNPVTLYSDANQNSEDQTFYTTSKKGWVCIDNTGGIKDLIVIINGKEMTIDTLAGLNRKQRVDVSEYINIGQNNVVYYIPKLENKRKSMKIYMEIKEAQND